MRYASWHVYNVFTLCTRQIRGKEKVGLLHWCVRIGASENNALFFEFSLRVPKLLTLISKGLSVRPSVSPLVRLTLIIFISSRFEIARAGGMHVSV